MVDENRSHLRAWLPWVDGTRTPEDTRRFLRAAVEAFEAGRTVTATIRHRRRLAGVIDLRIDEFNARGEIGYWLASGLQGSGVMTRSCRAIVAYGFASAGLHRIEIRCEPGNVRSCAIPERLGFVYEGTLRQTARMYERFADHRVYSMLEPEWRAATAAGKA